jgi:membrane protein implicated in regulation of membrane protease activity
MWTPILPWWSWVVLGVVLLLIEALTPGGLFVLFFGIAALIVGLLAALGIGEPLWVQVLLFAVLSIVSFVLFRRRLLGYIRSPGTPDVDTLVGEAAVALTDLPPRALGKVELRGTSWSARNAGEAPIVSGQRCLVERVEGLVLWLRAE